MKSLQRNFTSSITIITFSMLLFLVSSTPVAVSAAIHDAWGVDEMSSEMLFDPVPATGEPYVDFFFPSESEGVPVNTGIYAEIMGDGGGVNPSSVEMSVDGVAVSPEIEEIPGGISLYYLPDTPFPANYTVIVTLAACAQDVSTSSIEPDAEGVTQPVTPCMDPTDFEINTGSFTDDYGPDPWLGGYGGDPWPTVEEGGNIRLLAYMVSSDRENDIHRAEIYYDGLPTGFFLFDDGAHDDYDRRDGIFGLSASIPPGTQQGQYLLGIQPFDFQANPGARWPFLNNGPPFISVSVTRSIFRNILSIGRNGQEPRIEYAGYWDSILDPEMASTLHIVAFVTDPDGLDDVERVFLTYGGVDTGVELEDDGDSGDYAPDDNIYGFYAYFENGTSIPDGMYQIDIVAEDQSGLLSTPWPYFCIE